MKEKIYRLLSHVSFGDASKHFRAKYKSIKENKLKVGLLKIDIEGFESYLLQGAIETIKSQKPALLISIYHNGHDFFEIKPWLESLNLGYKFKIRKAWDHNTNRDTLLICEGR